MRIPGSFLALLRIIGITMSAVHIYLQFAHRIIIKILKEGRLGKIE